MKRSTLLNIFFLLLLIASFYIEPPYKNYCYYSALFALSGALTNEIAIFMIFNKVPYLYGSGVIEQNFEKFKTSLKTIIMEQFFSKEKIDRFLELELENLDFNKVVDNIDFSPAFESLKESIMESKFGSIINMLGGENALESLKVTFNKKLNSSIKSIINSNAFKNQLKNISKQQKSELVIAKIDTIINERLNELSPKDVNSLIKELIKEHLDWLIVWGAIFGALFGLLSTIAAHWL